MNNLTLACLIACFVIAMAAMTINSVFQARERAALLPPECSLTPDCTDPRNP